MEISCPHCSFSGTIKDGLIPESGSSVSCPKCKKKFFVTPEIPEMEVDMGGAQVTPAQTTDLPPTEEPLPRKKALPKQDKVKTLIVASGLILGMFLCFIAGRLSLGENPLAVSPGGPEKPAEPAKSPKTTETPTVIGGIASEMPLIVLPEGGFVGDETIDCAAIDKKVAEITALSDPEKSEKTRVLAEDLVGKNISGSFTIMRIGEVSFFFDELLKKKRSSLYVEAEAITKSPVHARVFFTLTSTNKEIVAVKKATRINVTGFIMSGRTLDGLELGLTNVEVRVVK